MLLAFLVGCAQRPATSAASPRAEGAAPASAQAELPIPEDLRDPIERSIAIGRELHILDKVSALGTDVLLAHVPDPERHNVAGYIPFREGDESGRPNGSFLVSFFTAEDPPRIAYDVRLTQDVTPEFRAFTPPRAAPSGFGILVRARQLAIAALPAIEQPINPLLLPASTGGEEGISVYLLAGTKRHDVAVLGRHFRALVTPDATSVSYMKALSNGILELPMRVPAGGQMVSLGVTHVVTEYPLETHVFASLLYKLPLSVATRRGLWRVDGDKISFRGELPATTAGSAS